MAVTNIIVHAQSLLVNYHHLLFMITIIVNLADCLVMMCLQMFTLMILCGIVMVAIVLMETIAVLIPACHGSIIS